MGCARFQCAKSIGPTVAVVNKSAIKNSCKTLISSKAKRTDGMLRRAII